MCRYETEISQAVDNPEEALSPMASGKPPAAGGEASISKSLWSGFITDTVQRPSSGKEEQIAEEDTAGNVLTRWRHMLHKMLHKTEWASLHCCEKSWWGEEEACGYEKHLFQIADNPEEALFDGPWTTQIASENPRRRCPDGFWSAPLDGGDEASTHRFSNSVWRINHFHSPEAQRSQ